jgi:aspartyl-tRNA(Asn)/glutamyl-tRNA(Gln) amidotransferase subunit C
MKVREQDVQYVADLANLELTPAERQQYIRDLNSILEYVEVLNELDTAGVEPFRSAAMVETVLLREDELNPGLMHDSALMNAPQTDGIFFQVPKVIEKPGEAKK